MIQLSRRSVLLSASVALGVAVLGVGGWLWYAAQQRRSLGEYAEAMTRASVAQLSPEARAVALRDLEAALQRHPSSPAAPQAAYQVGNLRFEAREYPAARAAYEVAVARGAAGTIRTLARAGIGYTWEAERDFPRAIEAYQATLRSLAPGDFLYEEVLLDLGRVQELAGRKSEAVETYRRILKDAPQSRRGDEIRARLAMLGVSSR